jgi:hypothetical protein
LVGVAPPPLPAEAAAAFSATRRFFSAAKVMADMEGELGAGGQSE